MNNAEWLNYWNMKDMLTFFRHIRKSLLASGAVRKYIPYAVGEVFLVMVGILLALQVNNWNENRKAKNTEIKFLSSILNNLKEDELQLKNNEKRLKASVNAISYLRDLELQNIIPDTLYKRLAELINFYKYHPIDNAYETLKSSGIIISNEELLNNISRYYEYEQSVVMSGSNDIEIQYYDYFEPYLRENIKEFKWLIKAVPYKVDQDFLNKLRPHLVSSFDNNMGTLIELQAFIEKGEELQAMITAELKHK